MLDQQLTPTNPDNPENQNPTGLQSDYEIAAWMSDRHQNYRPGQESLGSDPKHTLELLEISPEELNRIYNSLVQAFRDAIRQISPSPEFPDAEATESSISDRDPVAVRVDDTCLLIDDGAIPLPEAIKIYAELKPDAAAGSNSGYMMASRLKSALTSRREEQPDTDEEAGINLSEQEIQHAFRLSSALLLDSLQGKYGKQIRSMFGWILKAFQEGANFDYVEETGEGAEADWSKVYDAIANVPRSDAYEEQLPAAITYFKESIAGEDLSAAKEKNKSDCGRIHALFGRGGDSRPFWTKSALVKTTGIDRARVTVMLEELIAQKKIAVMNRGDDDNKTIYLDIAGQVSYKPGELITNVHADHFDQVGQFLFEKIRQGEKVTLKYLKNNDALIGIPWQVAAMILESFVAMGMIRKKNSAFELTEEHGGQSPGFHNFQAVTMATEAHSADDDSTLDGKDSPLPSLGELNEKFKQKWQRDKPEIECKTAPKILYLTQALHGDPELAVDFLEKGVSEIEALPLKERPDVVMMAGLIYGEFKNLEKSQRRRVVMPLDQQLYYAKQLVDRFRAMGIPVLYTLGKNDMLEIDQLAISMVFDIESKAKKGRKHIPSWAKEDADESAGTIDGSIGDYGANYKQVDQAKGHNQYMRHLEFSWQVAYPYMMRTGRALRSEGEMLNQHGVCIDEYLLLFYYLKKRRAGMADADITVDRATNGDPNVTGQVCVSALLDRAALPVDGNEWPDFQITSDHSATLTDPEGNEVTADVWGCSRLTQNAMVNNPLGELDCRIKQLKAGGVDPAHLNVDTSQRQMHFMMTTGSGEDDKGILLTPSMMQTNLDMSSFVTLPPSNGRRILTQRKRLENPGMITTQNHPDGRWQLEFMYPKLLEIAQQTTERVSVAILSDLQIGSVTARPDLQAKMFDYIFHDLMNRRKTTLVLLGDLLQGRNYPGMPIENRDLGLTSVDSQTRFILELIRKAIAGISPEALKNFEAIHTFAGNHEWNTGGRGGNHDSTGASQILPFEEFWRGQLPEATEKVFTHDFDTKTSDRGEYWRSWASRIDAADYRIMLDHYWTEFAAKGSGGPAILGAIPRIRGEAEMMNQTNFMVSGHFHHPSAMEVEQIIAIINGSIAGQSGYEERRGYRPILGPSILHLGGDRPPAWEIWTQKAMLNYEPKGEFSAESLAEAGHTDDAGFDPWRNGFGKIYEQSAQGNITQQPQGAIQKALWQSINQLNNRVYPLARR